MKRRHGPYWLIIPKINQNTLTIHFLNKGIITESYVRSKPIEHFERKPKSPPKQ